MRNKNTSVVSSLKPLSSGCENALNTFALAPLGVVFCHFEDSQWYAPGPLSTPIYIPLEGATPL